MHAAGEALLSAAGGDMMAAEPSAVAAPASSLAVHLRVEQLQGLFFQHAGVHCDAGLQLLSGPSAAAVVTKPGSVAPPVV